jgi:PAS domain S-box-containing protein
VEVLKEYSERLVNKLAEKKNELERANAELHETRDQLAHLLKHSPALIYSLKMEGGCTIPRFISENMTHLLGLTTEESCSFDWWMTHLHPEDREQAMTGVPETIKHGGWNAEYRIRHKAGHYLWVEDSRRLVRDTTGRPTDIIVVLTNITGRKQTENSILRIQRLESIGTLACGMAHDFNNVLSPIMLTAELLRLDFPEFAPESIDLIETSAKRGAEMVKQILTFVKGSEGERLLVQPEPLLKEMEKFIKISFPKRITLHTSHAGDLRPIMGDATQIQQVLLNLCINARDAMPDGGTLTLKAENIEIDAASATAVTGAKAGSYVAWTVTDTGTGIPAEILERIFEPFFSTKGPDKGTGLGLSTVNSIIKGHGGFIQVASLPGQGSTFTVCLPAAGSNAGTAPWPLQSETTFQGNGEAVLVVEENLVEQNLLRGLLTKLNFIVFTASDGTTALTQVAENQGQLRAVITSLHMDNMDGPAFTRVLKAKLPEAGIIVMSGNLDASTAAEFSKLGVVGLLEKPFDAEQMIAVLKKAFK